MSFFSPFLSRAHRLEPSDDELYQRTTVSVMQKDVDNGVLVHSYSSAGFNIDGNRVYGPCAVLPPAILQWKVKVLSSLSLQFVKVYEILSFFSFFFVVYFNNYICVCFLSLQIGSSKDITEESVSLFHMLEPKIGTNICTKADL